MLLDFEIINRRNAIDKSGRLVPGQYGKFLYYSLYSFMQFYALGAYEDFPGEDNIELDVVEISTIHQSKGLEWPVVFLPCLTMNRFPSSMMGSEKEWLVPATRAERKRYEGVAGVRPDHQVV